MARPERKDVDYFPFFIKDGRTLFILEGKYQCKGTGFFTNLFRFLSRTPDHHFQLDKEADRLFFFTATKCDEQSAIDMIEIMVETGKLDRDLWEQKKVLASLDFLESIQDAYRRRTNNCITLEQIKEHYRVTTGRNSHTTEYLPAETCLNGVTTGINPQSKVKYSKEDICQRLKFEKKVPIPKNFQLTPEMINYAKEKRYIGNLEEFTENFIKNCSANGRKYKDWYSAWQNWLLKDIGWHPEKVEPKKEYIDL